MNPLSLLAAPDRASARPIFPRPRALSSNFHYPFGRGRACAEATLDPARRRIPFAGPLCRSLLSLFFTRPELAGILDSLSARVFHSAASSFLGSTQRFGIRVRGDSRFPIFREVDGVWYWSTAGSLFGDFYLIVAFEGRRIRLGVVTFAESTGEGGFSGCVWLTVMRVGGNTHL